MMSRFLFLWSVNSLYLLAYELSFIIHLFLIYYYEKLLIHIF